MRMRDALGPMYADRAFAPLFPSRGQPAASPARLVLVTIMQFAEGLSDRQAADAVRCRIDWKYALALDLTDSGFDASVLSACRDRLLTGDPTALLFERMVEVLRGQHLLKERGRARTDSTHILAAIRTLSRLECVGETLAACPRYPGHGGSCMDAGVGTECLVRPLWPALRGLSSATGESGAVRARRAYWCGRVSPAHDAAYA